MTAVVDNVHPGALRQVLVVARLTLAEALRLKLTRLLGAVAGLLVTGALWLRQVHFGTPELRFLLDFGFGAIGLGGTLLAVLGTAQLFFSDIERRLLPMVLSRPVPREAWLAGKLAGVLALLALFSVALTALTALLLAWRARALGAELPLAEVLRGGALLWLRSAVAAGITLFVCAYARTALFASGAGLLLVLIGFLRPVADAVSAEWSAAGILRSIIRLWPNLQAFEPVETLVLSGRLAAYGLAYVVLFTAAAALAFRNREI